jgi:hypothetical protein
MTPFLSRVTDTEDDDACPHRGPLLDEDEPRELWIDEDDDADRARRLRLAQGRRCTL